MIPSMVRGANWPCTRVYKGCSPDAQGKNPCASLVPPVCTPCTRLARSSGGTPRDLLRCLRLVREYAHFKCFPGRIAAEVASKALELFAPQEEASEPGQIRDIGGNRTSISRWRRRLARNSMRIDGNGAGGLALGRFCGHAEGMASGPLAAVVVVLIFAGASFFFALAETALFSLSKWQVRQLAEREPRAGAHRGAVAGGAAGFAGDDGAGQYVCQRGDAGGGAVDGDPRALAAGGDGGGVAGADPDRLRGVAQDAGGAAAGAMGVAGGAAAGVGAAVQPAAVPGGAEDQRGHSPRGRPAARSSRTRR